DGDRVARALLAEAGAVESGGGLRPEGGDLAVVLLQQLLNVGQDHDPLVRPLPEDVAADGSDQDAFAAAGRGDDEWVARLVLEILVETVDGALLVVAELHGQAVPIGPFSGTSQRSGAPSASFFCMDFMACSSET